MEALFFTGQKIVAIQDHSKGSFFKGEEFCVLGISLHCCHVGIRIRTYNKGEVYLTQCDACGVDNRNTDGFYYDQSSFAPVQEIGSMTFEEAISYVQPKNIKLC